MVRVTLSDVIAYADRMVDALNAEVVFAWAMICPTSKGWLD